MDKEFQAYLENLKVSSVVISRVENLITMLQEIIKPDFTGIFLSDFITQDGTMQFDTLYLFSDAEILQARNFLQIDNFELGDIKKNCSSIEIQQQDYDFKTITEKSRLTITVKFATSDRIYPFKASRENCVYLKRIFELYLRPNIMVWSATQKVRIVDS
jgi:hypothetical protein